MAKLRALPRVMVQDFVPEVADILRADLHSTISAGTAPDGVPWVPRKADGSRPLENAESAVTVEARSNTVYVRIKGINQKHHWGAVRGGTVRQIIYKGTQLPARVVLSIQKAASKRFIEFMGETGRGAGVNSGL